MKFLFDLLVAFLPQLFAPVVDAIKTELLKVYVQGVNAVRGIFILTVLTIFGVMLAVAGFVMIHIAAYFLLPWSPQTNALILLGAGLIYLLVPTIFIFRICSQKAWLRMSGAESMARGILNK